MSDNQPVMETEQNNSASPINQLVDSWELANEYEKIDEEAWESDVRLAVLEDLNKLSRKDRKLFWEKVKSSNQNGN